jgi:hypothetical protein
MVGILCEIDFDIKHMLTREKNARTTRGDNMITSPKIEEISFGMANSNRIVS